jgi:phosphomannomutase/phosphoglucomutase
MTDLGLFGTNGVRGIINDSLTPQMALDLGRAIGSVIEGGTFAISRDSRNGGMMFAGAITSGLLSTGCSLIDIGPGPTPMLQFMVPRLGCAGGIIITASHNPPEFNGIKVMGSDGIEASRDLEEKFERAYFEKSFKTASWSNIGNIFQNDTAIGLYLKGIKSHVDNKSIENSNLKVVVDCANSVGALITPRLLRELGCKIFSLNSQQDGGFPGRYPEPIPQNLTDLSKAVVSVGADLGIAHDGDADRATFVDETGRILWGDQSFALVASRILARKKGSTLVTPVSSGRLIEDVVHDAGATIDWTVVGSVVVSHRLKEIGAELGGEENGGVFYPPHQPVRDGAMTAAQVIEIVAIEKKKLSQLIDELPSYVSAKTKVRVPAEKKDAVLDVLLKMTEGQERITLDGVKLLYDEGWVLIRPSGTEPVYRCFSESDTQENADELNQRGVNLLKEAIQKA